MLEVELIGYRQVHHVVDGMERDRSAFYVGLLIDQSMMGNLGRHTSRTCIYACPYCLLRTSSQPGRNLVRIPTNRRRESALQMNLHREHNRTVTTHLRFQMATLSLPFLNRFTSTPTPCPSGPAIARLSSSLTSLPQTYSQCSPNNSSYSFSERE